MKRTTKWMQLAAVTCAALLLSLPVSAQTLPTDPLDPASIPKFVTPLVIPPAMPRAAKLPAGVSSKKVDYYEIALKQFDQQVLPPGFPKTTLWGYVSADNAATAHSPSFTIEAKYSKPVQVKWINGLVDANGNYLPHLLPIDQTIHWANPAGGLHGRDMETKDPTAYKGPVPMVVHLHGAHAPQESDGFPQAWYLPNARNIPTGYATTGTAFDEFLKTTPFASRWGNGAAVYEYDNAQPASTLWFHDHTMGITRLNVYAGPAGFYLLRGGPSDMVGGILPGPAPAIGDPAGKKYYEIPIAIQDRSFRNSGALAYPESREPFDGFKVPYIPALVPGEGTPPSDISPIWNPEVFGDTMVVNGHTWPFLNVEARRYRFRFLNGSNSRFLILQLSDGTPFWQIGADGGFLPAPVQLQQLLMGPAERADVIVDFTNVPVGTRIVLQNLGPDEPFGGVLPGSPDYVAANPDTTGQVMELRVVKRTSTDFSTPPARLALPAPPAITGPLAVKPRELSLNEYDSETVCLTADANGDVNVPISCLDSTSIDPFGPQMARLGTAAGGVSAGFLFQDAITEDPKLGEVEVWTIRNGTADAHPIHIHQVQFEVLDRVSIADYDLGLAGRGPEPWETGLKDTVVAYPDEVTLVKAKFDRKGLYVWHCHILEHEDNDMMRPICATPDPVTQKCTWPLNPMGH